MTGWCGGYALFLFVRADRRRERMELAVDQVEAFVVLALEAVDADPRESLIKRVIQANLAEASRLLVRAKKGLPAHTRASPELRSAGVWPPDDRRATN